MTDKVQMICGNCVNGCRTWISKTQISEALYPQERKHNSIHYPMADMRKYLTWHPQGKAGCYISKKDYEITRDFILSTLASGEMKLLELISLGEQRLEGQIDEKIAWHILVVKLDLEARGIVVSFSKFAPFKSQFMKLSRVATKQITQYRDGNNGLRDRR